MLIKCSECGHENQLGAIFCRNCGEKLNIEEMRPSVKGSGMKFDFFKILRTAIGLAILGGLIWVICSLFMTPDMPKSDLAEDLQEAAKKKCEIMIRSAKGENIAAKKFPFTAEEATYCYNEMFIEEPEEGEEATYNVEGLTFDISDEGDVTIFMQTKLGGKLDTVFQITGKPVDPGDDDGVVDFEVSSSKMGKIAIPNSIKNKIIEKFIPATEGGSLDQVIPAIKSIEVDGETDTFTITLK